MKAILGSVERDVADAFAYIPYGLAAAVVFLLIMILYNRKKYGRVSFIIKSSLLIIYVVVVVNIPVRQHRKSGRRETVCPGLRKPLMRVYSRNVLSKP